jgi:hypothetical protein
MCGQCSWGRVRGCNNDDFSLYASGSGDKATMKSHASSRAQDLCSDAGGQAGVSGSADR